MNWILSYEEKQRLAAEKAELRKMAREDFARAKRSKYDDEKKALYDSGNRRIEIAKNKG